MSWSAAIHRAIRYLPQIGGLYFVSWLIFSLASWLLVQALKVDSALWILMAGLQYLVGALVVVGGTLAFGIKVIADTVINPETESESNLPLPSTRTVVTLIAAIVGLLFVVTLLANLGAIMASADQKFGRQETAREVQQASRNISNQSERPFVSTMRIPTSSTTVPDSLKKVSDLDVTRLREYVVQWLLDNCAGNLPGEEANFRHHQLDGFTTYGVEEAGEHSWIFTSGSETWLITESPVLEVTNPHGNAWCLK